VLYALFVWLISHQPAVLFSQNKPIITNQLAVLFSQNKSASAISHQPNEQADRRVTGINTALSQKAIAHICNNRCSLSIHAMMLRKAQAKLSSKLKAYNTTPNVPNYYSFYLL
jgi:chromosome segregation and condensation protein ScpB